MKIVVLLHFYQPHNQQSDILKRIVNESYRPILEGLLKNSKSKVVINIPGALTSLLKSEGYVDVLEKMKTLVEKGQAAFTSTAMYHAFLPLLPKDEIERQITLNNDINQEYFGKSYDPLGFFSPEMAVSASILHTVTEFKYSWICVPQLSFFPKKPKTNMLYLYKDTAMGDDRGGGSGEEYSGRLNLFFRNKRVSSLILSATSRSVKDLVKQTKDIHSDKYWFTVMDAETFGHHRIGHEKLLFQIMDSEFFEPVFPSEIILGSKKLDLREEFVTLQPGTWTNEEQDFWLEKETGEVQSHPFILWQDPKNPIHKLQWELTNFTIDLVNSSKDSFGNSLKKGNDGSKNSNKNSSKEKKFSSKGGRDSKDIERGDKEGSDEKVWERARSLLDKALASDQFWWASAKPWWSLEMVEQGAFQLKSVVTLLHRGSLCSKKDYKKAYNLYYKILDKAFEWQREGVIRKKHLQDSATFMEKPFKKRAPAEWYNQIILEFEDQMNKASSHRNFEEAIKWRDALTKLDLGTDIYDVLHVVDELWSARNIPEVKPFLAHNWEEFSKVSKKYFRNIKGKEDFEKWKKNGKL